MSASKPAAPTRRSFVASLGAAFGSSLGVAAGFALDRGPVLVIVAAAAGALAGGGLCWLLARPRGPSPSGPTSA